jgi:hypothetical protein
LQSGNLPAGLKLLTCDRCGVRIWDGSPANLIFFPLIKLPRKLPGKCFKIFHRRLLSNISSVVRQMPRYNSPRRDTARTVPNIFVLFYVLFLCCSMYCFVLFYVFCLCCSMYGFVVFYVLFCVVLCIFCFVLFYVWFCGVLCIVLCCSMYCFVLFYVWFCGVLCIVCFCVVLCTVCVNVYYTTATGWQRNCS